MHTTPLARTPLAIPEEYQRARDVLRAQLTPEQAAALRTLQAPDVSIDDLLVASRFVRATVLGHGLLVEFSSLGETHSLWICLLDLK